MSSSNPSFPTPFEKELNNGRLVCPECPRCDKVVWPPNENCNLCFSQVHWREINKTGSLIECSVDYHGNLFCIAEFEGRSVRLVGKLENKDGSKDDLNYEGSGNESIDVGAKVCLKKCGYDKDSGRPFYVFEMQA